MAEVKKTAVVKPEVVAAMKAEAAAPAKAGEVKKVAEPVKEAVKKEEPKKEVAKKAPAKKAAAPKKETVKKAEPAKKAAAPKKEVAKKAPAKKTATKAAVKSTVTVEFANKSYSEEQLVKIAKDVWKYDLKKEKEFSAVDIYVKPEEARAYFVVDGETYSFAI